MTEAGAGSNVLKFTELTIMDNNKCRDAWERGDTFDEVEITKNMICAWHSSGSACYGDSGGPLSCQPGILYNSSELIKSPIFLLKSYSGFERPLINYLSWEKFGMRFDYLK